MDFNWEVMESGVWFRKIPGSKVEDGGEGVKAGRAIQAVEQPRAQQLAGGMPGEPRF